MGSCFADMVGNRLQQGKFQAENNPFGIIYNPISLLNLIQISIEGKDLDSSGMINQEGILLHYQLHSDLSSSDEQHFFNRFREVRDNLSEKLKICSHLFLTWGTAFVYERKEDGKPVANCHKQPAHLFHKRLLELEEMKTKFHMVYYLLKHANPRLKIVLTLSPVRHTKDGIPENQVSKSLLRVFCHEIQATLSDVSYFPAYEWLLDDLRDYRFYSEDLVHPSKMAEEYIWDKFLNTYLKSEDRAIYDAVAKVQLSLGHKPFNPQSQAHQRFLQRLILEMERLGEEIDFSEEINLVKNQLI